MKKTIELSTEQAREYYNDPKGFKRALEAYFSKEELTKKDWRKIKTFEDACDILNEDINVFENMFKSLSISSIAYIKLEIIFKAINGDWVIDWGNRKQYKWYPYFTIEDGGGALAGLLYTNANFSGSYTFTYFGGRLYAESEEKARYIGMQFIKIYSDYTK